MRAPNWSDPTSPEAAARRAGGRRKIKARRQLRAQMRRLELLRLATRHGLMLTAWSTQSALARMLQVSRSTVYRDVRAILADMNREKTCPCCRRPIPRG